MDLKEIESELIKTFVKVFDCDSSPQMVANMKYKIEPAWDSFGHMALMAQINLDFSVELTFEEMVSLLSFEDCVKFLSKGI
jgi:acyl carrier protein